MKIFCDLDGVLVDLEAGIRKLPDGEARLSAGSGKWKLPNHDGFWADLPWMSDGRQLWNAIKGSKPTILTKAPRNNPYAPGNKKSWVRKNLGDVPTIVVTGTKSGHAEKGHILIDDMEKNISEWRARGGIGILHKNTSATLAELKKHMGSGEMKIATAFFDGFEKAAGRCSLVDKVLKSKGVTKSKPAPKPAPDLGEYWKERGPSVWDRVRGTGGTWVGGKGKKNEPSFSPG